jgi:hypothetical protein
LPSNDGGMPAGVGVLVVGAAEVVLGADELGLGAETGGREDDGLVLGLADDADDAEVAAVGWGT